MMNHVIYESRFRASCLDCQTVCFRCLGDLFSPPTQLPRFFCQMSWHCLCHIYTRHLGFESASVFVIISILLGSISFSQHFLLWGACCACDINGNMSAKKG